MRIRLVFVCCFFVFVWFLAAVNGDQDIKMEDLLATLTSPQFSLFGEGTRAHFQTAAGNQALHVEGISLASFSRSGCRMYKIITTADRGQLYQYKTQ